MADFWFWAGANPKEAVAVLWAFGLLIGYLIERGMYYAAVSRKGWPPVICDFCADEAEHEAEVALACKASKAG